LQRGHEAACSLFACTDGGRRTGCHNTFFNQPDADFEQLDIVTTTQRYQFYIDTSGRPTHVDIEYESLGENPSFFSARAVRR
jgi:hypothetical protein